MERSWQRDLVPIYSIQKINCEECNLIRLNVKRNIRVTTVGSSFVDKYLKITNW